MSKREILNLAALNSAILFDCSPARHGEGLKDLVVTSRYSQPTKPGMGLFAQQQVGSLRALGPVVDVLCVNGPACRPNGAERVRRLALDEVARRIYGYVL